MPLLERMKQGAEPSALAVPWLSAYGEDHLAQLFREHLTKAGVKRAELHASTRTHVQANFRSCRDSGITWLAMSGLGVDKIVRRAGHDDVQTSMGYVSSPRISAARWARRSPRCRHRSSRVNRV